MSLLTVVKDVCLAVGVAVPQSVFTNITGNRTMAEMLSKANEMAQRIAYDTRDWTKLKKVQTFTGDGVTTAFDMPANYKRMLLTANVWRSTSTQQPLTFLPDTDEWLNRRYGGYDNAAWGEWTLIGGQMRIWPAMGVDVTAYFPYLDKNCVALAGGGFGDAFQSDGDTFALDERVLKLGMIWQWKADKGGAYAEDMGSYGDALAMAQGHDSPAPIIIGRLPMSRSARIAYPWPLPT
jgi:hypothetical protein